MTDHQPKFNFLPITQSELIRRIDGRHSDGMCGGAVFAAMALFYKTTAEVLNSTYNNFFTTRADPILDLALLTERMHQKLIESQGCLQPAIEENFFNGKRNGALLLNEVDHTLEFYRLSLEKGTSVICTEVYLIHRQSKQPSDHLVGLFNFKEQLLFVEPNYGYYFFDNFEEFSLWYKQQCAIGGILAYMYKDSADTAPTKHVGLARNYKATAIVASSFQLTEKRNPMVPRTISSRIQTMPFQPIAAKL